MPFPERDYAVASRFHSVEITEFHCHHFLAKIPRKQLSLKNHAVILISQNIFEVTVNFWSFHSLWIFESKFREIIYFPDLLISCVEFDERNCIATR